MSAAPRTPEFTANFLLWKCQARRSDACGHADMPQRIAARRGRRYRRPDGLTARGGVELAGQLRAIFRRQLVQRIA